MKRWCTHTRSFCRCSEALSYLFSLLPFPVSLNPFAKGLLSIFSCVICTKHKEVINLCGIVFFFTTIKASSRSCRGSLSPPGTCVRNNVFGLTHTTGELDRSHHRPWICIINKSVMMGRYSHRPLERNSATKCSSVGPHMPRIPRKKKGSGSNT